MIETSREDSVQILALFQYMVVIITFVFHLLLDQVDLQG